MILYADHIHRKKTTRKSGCLVHPMESQYLEEPIRQGTTHIYIYIYGDMYKEERERQLIVFKIELIRNGCRDKFMDLILII